MKNQRSKKFVCFFDRDGRFLGALPEDARIGDVGACGLRGVHSIECLDRGGIAREIESEELDDWAEEELIGRKEGEAEKRASDSAADPFAGMDKAFGRFCEEARRVIDEAKKGGSR